jgi:hypothetical protein
LKYPGMKKVIGERLFLLIKQHQEELANFMKVEVMPVSDLETQVKIWETVNSPPRYFTVRLREHV